MGAKLGQVFIHDGNIIRKIIAESSVSRTDHVWEIGCGDGILTEALMTQTDHLTVFEIDPKCIASTQNRIGSAANVQYIQGDFLDSSRELPDTHSVKIVANIPYYISTPILKRIIGRRNQIEYAVLMVQEEFARKLLAKPGSSLYTSFSVYFSAFLDTEYLFSVSRNCFYPIPKVDSAVIRVTPNEKYPDLNDDLLFTIVQSGFWGRRKPLRSALQKSPYLELDTEFKTIPFFESNPNIRAETLDLDAFYQLYKSLIPYVKSVKSGSSIDPETR